MLQMTFWVFFYIIESMVIDNSKDIASYFGLDEGLRDIRRMESSEIPAFHGYMVDKDHTVVFFVNSGSAVFSTTWRENPKSMEALSAATVCRGGFALFLPGEPFIVRYDDAEVSMFVIGE